MLSFFTFFKWSYLKCLEKLYVRATNDFGYLTQSYAKYMQIDCIFIGCLMIPHYSVITFLFTLAFG